MPSRTEDLVDGGPPSIDPYGVLQLDKKATADQVKSAYRKAALRHHPDKAREEDKETAHKKFQEVAFAYAILSDERRRARYDTSGRTEDTLDIDDDDFNWSSFFREQFRDVVGLGVLDEFEKKYKGSDEEKKALMAAYEKGKGSMKKVYEGVMCSNPLDDEDRFRQIIDAEIQRGNVMAFAKYRKETIASQKRRIARAIKEAKEAEEHAEWLGLKKKKDDTKHEGQNPDAKTAKDAEDEERSMAQLQAVITQRQNDRAAKSDAFFDTLEVKYGGNGAGKKRGLEDEPPEEAFKKNAKRAKQSKPKAKMKAK